jgi:hypothetical protein
MREQATQARTLYGEALAALPRADRRASVPAGARGHPARSARRNRGQRLPGTEPAHRSDADAQALDCLENLAEEWLTPAVLLFCLSAFRPTVVDAMTIATSLGQSILERADALARFSDMEDGLTCAFLTPPTARHRRSWRGGWRTPA